MHRVHYGNSTGIFTSSGKAAREFRYKAGISMIGVNIGVAAPMAFFPFGGARSSFYGDLKAQGKARHRFLYGQTSGHFALVIRPVDRRMRRHPSNTGTEDERR